MMAIEAKDIMMGLRFKAYGNFVSVYIPDGEGRKPTFRFEYLGGQFSVEVNETEAASPPPAGTAFYVAGKVRYNSYNGSISFSNLNMAFPLTIPLHVFFRLLNPVETLRFYQEMIRGLSFDLKGKQIAVGGIASRGYYNEKRNRYCISSRHQRYCCND